MHFSRDSRRAIAFAALLVIAAPAVFVTELPGGVGDHAGTARAADNVDTGTYVYYGGNSGEIVRVFQSNGTKDWSVTQHGNNIVASLELGRNGEYLYSDASSLKRLHASNGSQDWSNGIDPNDISQGPDDGLLYVSTGGAVEAIHKSNGTNATSYSINNSETIDYIAVDSAGEIVYTFGQDSLAAAWYLDNGTNIWKNDMGTGGSYGAQLGPNEEYWYVSSNAGSSVYKLSTSTGVADWSHSFADYPRAIEVDANSEYVYAGVYNGNFVQLYDANGTAANSVAAGFTSKGIEVTRDGADVFYGGVNTPGMASKNADWSDRWSIGASEGPQSMAILDETPGSGSSNADLSATVETQDDGNPVPNATYRVIEVNRSAFTGTQQEVDNKINDLEDRLREVEPDRYNGDRQLTGATGALQNADGKVPLVHTANEWNIGSGLGDRFLDVPVLRGPTIQQPAGEELIVSLWDPSKEELVELGPVNSKLHGQVVAGNVTVHHLGPDDSIVDTYQAETEVIGTGVYGTEYHGIRINPQPGFYVIDPENGPPITYLVGDYEDITGAWRQNLKTRIGALSNRSQYIDDLQTDSKLVGTTGVTDENGSFTVSPGANTERVGLIAYKAPNGISTDPQNLTEEDVRVYFNDTGYNGSVYVSTRPKFVDADANNTTVEVREVSAPPYASLSRVEEAKNWLDNYLDNHTYAEAASAVIARLRTLDNEKVKDYYRSQIDVLLENAEAEQQAKEYVADETGQDPANVNINIDPSNATNEELITRLEATERALQELESSIESTEGTQKISNETLSASRQFDADLSPENVQLFIRYANGSTDVLSPDSEYVTIDSSLTGGDTVRIEDYPVGDTAATSIQWRVVTSEGKSEATDRVTNPAFSGDIPRLDAIDVSTLNPGPDESVTLNVRPKEAAQFGSVQNVTVYDAEGTKLNTTLVDDDTARFTTNGEGVHHARVTYTNGGGDQFVTAIRLEADGTSRNLPSGIRMQQSPVGTYAVTGEAFESGRVEVQNGGGTINVLGQLPDKKDDVPGTVHVYTHGVSRAPDATTNIAVVRGDSEKAVNKNVRVQLHTESMADSTLVYREAGDESDPLPTSETAKGLTIKRDTNATVKTYTGDNGRVGVRTVSNPGPVQRATYWVQVRIGDLPNLPALPFTVQPPQAAPLLG
ncbi:YncE family protein [Haloarcula sp. JP-L23]|uniref:YncE family protein n=1 Tax=Haloarcula sp. JP-L23 TaxID=2716717 RepID=UPI00140EA309|nr:hypothetical protein G9465_24430 [Haloarcula sp. JP-L23]